MNEESTRRYPDQAAQAALANTPDVAVHALVNMFRACARIGVVVEPALGGFSYHLHTPDGQCLADETRSGPWTTPELALIQGVADLVGRYALAGEQRDVMLAALSVAHREHGHVRIAEAIDRHLQSAQAPVFDDLVAQFRALLRR